MKNTILSFLLIILTYISVGQDIPRDIVSKQQQIDFIKSSHLPVKVTPLPTIINTPFSEYKGILLEDSTFIFNATRSNNFVDDENIFSTFWSADIYASQLTTNGYSEPKKLSQNINQGKYFNTNFTITERQNRLLFVRCIRSETDQLSCEIWESQKQHNVWNKAQKLPKIINCPNYNTTFPHIVENEDYSILYFSSDRPGTIGGMDLWYSIFKNGKYQTPINLGPQINSVGNEITPFYDRKEGILYFSSDEWLSLGGYDIFYSIGNMSQWGSPTNMGIPFNSEENDFYYTKNEFNNKGYFSSNRPNELYGIERKCCNDLYEFEWEITKDSIISDTTNPSQEKEFHFSPITLYFDNDHPNPRSLSPNTTYSYDQLFSKFIARKEEYIKVYCHGFSPTEHKKADLSYQKFFQDSVISGYQSLVNLAEQIFLILKNGDSVTLVISGYASPLHNNEYNRLLSMRRIESIKNFLLKYDEGILAPYINHKKFTFEEYPQGNITGEIITNKRKDIRLSVYSLKAARERRVQIENIIIVKNKKIQ